LFDIFGADSGDLHFYDYIINEKNNQEVFKKNFIKRYFFLSSDKNTFLWSINTAIWQPFCLSFNAKA